MHKMRFGSTVCNTPLDVRHARCDKQANHLAAGRLTPTILDLHWTAPKGLTEMVNNVVHDPCGTWRWVFAPERVCNLINQAGTLRGQSRRAAVTI